MADWTAVDGAAKDDAGNYVALVNGEWKPAMGAAKNDKGEYMALFDNAPHQSTAAELAPYTQPGRGIIGSVMAAVRNPAPPQAVPGTLMDNSNRTESNYVPTPQEQTNFDALVGPLAQRRQILSQPVTGVVGPIQGAAPSIGSVASDLAAAPGRGMESLAGNIEATAGNIVGSDYLRDKGLKRSANAELASDVARPDFGDSTVNSLYGGVRGLAETAPALAAGMATGSIPLGAAAFGLTGAAEQGEKITARGGTPGETALGAGLGGTISAVTGAMPLSNVVNNLGKTATSKFLYDQLFNQLGANVASSVANSAVDAAIANPKMTFEEWANQQPENIRDAVIGAVGGALPFAIPHSIAAAHHDAMARIQAANAQRDAQTGAALSDLEKANSLEDMVAVASAHTSTQDPLMAQVLSAADQMKAVRAVQAGVAPENLPPQARGIINSVLALPAPKMNPGLMIADENGYVRPATQREYEANNVQPYPQQPGIAGLLPAPEQRAALPAPDNLGALENNPTRTGNFRVTPEGTAFPETAGDLQREDVPNRTRVGNLPDRTVESPARPEQMSATEAAAHLAATSPRNDLPEPTPAQADAGNYKVGRLNIGGLNISVENPEGSTRSGTDDQGHPWQTTMTDAHYGYIRGSIGVDKDHVDAFVRPGTPQDYAGPVFVVDQVDPKTGAFDEHKAMIGYPDEASARAAYRANYEQNWPGDAAVTAMPFDKFKAWALDHEATQRPAAPEAVAQTQAAMAQTAPVHEALHNDLMKGDVAALSKPEEPAHADILKSHGATDEQIAALQAEAPASREARPANEPAGAPAVPVPGGEGQSRAQKRIEPSETLEMPRKPGSRGVTPEIQLGQTADGQWANGVSVHHVNWIQGQGGPIDTRRLFPTREAALADAIDQSRKIGASAARATGTVAGEAAKMQFNKWLDGLRGKEASAEPSGPELGHQYPLLRDGVSPDEWKAAVGRQVAERSDEGIVHDIALGERSLQTKFGMQAKAKKNPGYFPNLQRDIEATRDILRQLREEQMRRSEATAPIQESAPSTEASPETTRPEGYGAQNKVFTQDAAEKARALLRSKLSQLNSGIDPEILQAGLTLAGYHIEAGARSFADFTKAMLADLGEKARPYLRSWYESVRHYPGFDAEGMSKPEEIERANAPKVERLDMSKPEHRLAVADRVASRLLEGGYKSIAEARAHVSELTGEEIKPGTTAAKRADEVIELGVVRAARKVTEGEGTPQEKYERLVDLYKAQPNLNVRTSTSVEQQAYSTPAPLAYIASRLAGIDRNTKVYEPSAGNGMLLLDANPKKVTAGELNPDRADALRAQGFSPMEGDATKAKVEPRSQDAVIENPPFGVVKDDSGRSVKWDAPSKVAPGGSYKTGEIDHAIALKSLEAMKDDGRAVLILGGVNKLVTGEARSDAYNNGAKRDFFYSLYRGYNVVDHFTVNGDLYAKQGAGWPVDVIVIHGREPSQRPLPAVEVPRQYDSWSDLKGKLDADENGRLGAEPAQDGMAVRDGESAGRVNTDTGSAPVAGEGTGAATRGQRGAQAGDAAGAGSGGQPSGESAAGEPAAGRDGGRAGGGVEKQPRGARSVDLEGRNDTGAAERDAGGLGRDDVAGVAGKRDVVQRQEQETETQVHYEPASKVGNVGTLVPVNMREAIRDSLAKLQDRVGNVDHFVTRELGYKPGELGSRLSAEQVDAVAMAIDNLKRGGGFIIGDQTGIGKGRTNAAIIRWAMKNGETPVFVTAKPNLYADMFRDLKAVGSGDARILMTNADTEIALDDKGTTIKTPPAKAWNAKLRQMIDDGKLGDHDVIFTTYDSLNTLGGAKTVRMDLVEHFGKNGILILDESHSAGGGSKPAFEGAPEEMNRGSFFRGLVRGAKGVFYSSATYAKRPDVMDLYAKTAMKDAVSDPKDIGEAISKGGVPLQQAVAAMLARAGQMIRRERTFAGIEYNTVPAEVDKVAPERAAAVMRAIMNFDEMKKQAVQRINKELKAEAKKLNEDGSTGGAGAQSTNFTSLMHNVIAQMLLGLKVKPAVDEVIASLKRGEKPVLTLANTMESMLSDFAKEHKLGTGDPIAMHFGDLLEHYLERSREVSTKQAFQKGGEKRRLSDEELGPSTTAAFNAIRDQIRAGDWSQLPISPIDYIHDQIRRAGYKSGEITGRTMGVDYGGNVPLLRNRPGSEKSVSGRLATLRAFNNGETHALILNQAGSTGLSAHASPETGRDLSVRHMIIAQPELNIDTHMQMLGRVNRTGQVVPPKYSQLAADIPAEMRPAAVLAKKMASLNANTTASRKSALTSDKTPDFLNDYGDEVIASMMDGDHDLHKRLGKPLSLDKESDQFERDGAARKVTGRIPVLPLDEQRKVYDQIAEDYQSLLEQKKALGENALEAQTLPLDAKPEKSVTLVPGTGESEFQGPAVATQVDAKKLGKPYTSEQVLGILRDRLGVTGAGRDAQDSLQGLRNEGQSRMASTVADTRRQFDTWLKGETLDMEDRERETFELRALTSMRKLQEFAEKFSPGQTIELKNSNGSVMNGVVLGMERKGIAKNPAANGAWRMTVALADAAKQVTIPISRLTTGEEQGMTRIGQADSDWNGVPILKTFDSGQTTLREKRTIVTGNLLKAYAAVGKGQIVNYTTHEGKVEQGILMPKDFDADKEVDKAAREQAAIIKSPDEVKPFLSGGRQRSISNDDGSVRILRNNYGEYIISTPASKKEGGQYFLNKELRNAIGGDFVKSGSQMRAQFTDTELPQVIDTLLGMGKLKGVDPFAAKPMASRESADSLSTAGFKKLAESPDAFRNPKATATDLPGIARQIDPGYRVIPLQPETAAMKSADRAWDIKVPGSDFRGGTVYERGDRVWIDVSRLIEGKDAGSKIYAMVADYAHNTGKVFVGDPSGLSTTAYMRRTENMVSSILKHGTSDHVYPHAAQVDPRGYYDKTGFGNFADGLRGLDWRDGDTTHNLRQLMYASASFVKKHVPDIGQVVYDFDNHTFKRLDTGERFSDEDFQDAAQSADARSARAGSSTLKRAALYNTFSREKSSEGRGRVLAALDGQLPRGLDPQLREILYSRDTEARPDAGLSTSGVRNVIDQHFGPGVSDRLERAGLLNIRTEHPEGDADVRGEYFPGADSAALYAKNLREDTVIPTVYHELGEHFGLQRLLGEDGYDRLARDLKLAQNNPEVKGAADAVRAAYPELKNATWDNERFVHEVAANLGQNEAARNQSWFTRMTEGIKRFLRTNFGIGQISGKEVGYLLNGAVRKAVRDAGASQAESAARGEPAMAARAPAGDRMESDELAKLPKAPASAPEGFTNLSRADAIGRVKEMADRVLDPLKMALDPMEKGSERGQAMVKDAANAIRYARFQWTKIDEILRREFTPEEQERMWNAADEENDILGGTSPDLPGMGLKSLTDKQRAVMDTMHQYGEELLQRARDVGMFEGEGVPYWAPRMAAMIGEDGDVARVPGGTPDSATGGQGANVTKTSSNLRKRKYLTTEETEAAGKSAFGDDFQVVRNIRTMPLAMERLERAIAGRELIDKIKEAGEAAGQTTVGTGRDSREFFTLDHPAFKTYRYLKDDRGDWTRERVPLWVSKEFEGPLKALLSEKQGDLYKAAMAIKGAATSTIMFSPLIHNAVVWGKAVPAMPGKALTFRVYFDGNKAKNDTQIMKRAILNGLMPIGKMGGYQDITGIAKGLGDDPGKFARAIGYVVGAAAGKDVGAKVTSAVHAAGDFWHNTLLWDRVGDLQAGLYTNIERDLIKNGMDPRAAGIEAAHFANLYAGAIPNESMSNMLRKTANVLLFSRSFTMSNMGAMQAMARGLPPEMQAQIRRDVGDLGLQAAQGSARRKAIGMFMMDVGLAWGAMALLRAGIQGMQGQSLDDIEQGYLDRFNGLLARTEENPLSVINPLDDLAQLGPGGDNEPGKENRVLTGYDSQGTAQYLRLPFGKTAEELSGYSTDPMKVLTNKESTLLRPALQWATNDLGYGKRLYNPDDPAYKKAAKVIWNFLSQQVPLDTIQSAARMGTGNTEDQDMTKVVGAITGFTTSHGARGGPEVGMEYQVKREKQARIADAMPDAMQSINRAVRLETTDPTKSGELYDEAIERLREAGLTDKEIGARIKMARDPRAGHLTPKAMRSLYENASDEEQRRLEAYQRDTAAAGVDE